MYYSRVVATLVEVSPQIVSNIGIGEVEPGHFVLGKESHLVAFRATLNNRRLRYVGHESNIDFTDFGQRRHGVKPKLPRIEPNSGLFDSLSRGSLLQSFAAFEESPWKCPPASRGLYGTPAEQNSLRHCNYGADEHAWVAVGDGSAPGTYGTPPAI
jgi:hypothetical protein